MTNEFNVNAQNASGDAPVFVGSVYAYRDYVNTRAISSYRWMKNGFYFLIPAFTYAAAFSVAEWQFPQLYRAWLDLFMPFVEYVSEFTPRADKAVEDLSAGGYPERADFAFHFIAMAGVFSVPAAICFVISFLATFGTLPLSVSCTRWTHIGMWLTMLGCIAMGTGCLIFWEILASETFGGYSRLDRFSDYHRGNSAVIGDILWAFSIPMFFILGARMFLLLCITRFNIITQPY